MTIPLIGTDPLTLVKGAFYKDMCEDTRLRLRHRVAELLDTHWYRDDVFDPIYNSLVDADEWLNSEAFKILEDLKCG